MATLLEMAGMDRAKVTIRGQEIEIEPLTLWHWARVARRRGLNVTDLNVADPDVMLDFATEMLLNVPESGIDLEADWEEQRRQAGKILGFDMGAVAAVVRNSIPESMRGNG